MDPRQRAEDAHRAAAQRTSPTYSRERLLEYERLYDEWRRAQEAARTAVLSLVADELDGRPVSEERRAEVARLEAESRRLMIATYKAQPPTTRW